MKLPLLQIPSVTTNRVTSFHHAASFAMLALLVCLTIHMPAVAHSHPTAAFATLPLIAAQAGAPEAAREEPEPQFPTGALEEIVVTARKREESLQNTSIAVTVFSADELNEISATSIGDVSEYTPNMVRTTGPTGGSDGYFFIRGVGQNDLVPAVDPGVGTYLDGVYLGRIMGASFDSLDVERVEVLRGPQGTLFGRNTIGGAINVITKDPGDEFGAQLVLTAGSRDRLDAQVSTDLPISDTLKVRLSGVTRNQDGWGHRADGATFGDVETVGGRIKVLWEAADNLEFRLSADATSEDGTPAHSVLTAFAAPFSGRTSLAVPFPPANTFTPYIFGMNPDLDIFDNNTSQQPIDELDVWGSNVTVDWDVAGVNLKSITSYREMDEHLEHDFDNTPFSFYDGFFDTEQEQFSQEFQLNGLLFEDRVNWLVGFYYFNEDIAHDKPSCSGTNTGTPPPVMLVPNDGRCIINNQTFDVDIDSWAVFAHLDFNITEKLSAIVGVRYTDEEKNYAFDLSVDNRDGVFSFFNRFGVFLPGTVTPTLSPDNPNLGFSPNVSDSWDSTTPKFGLDYQYTDDVLLYASYSEGFKSGGFNGRPAPRGGVFTKPESFDPEELTSFEVGMKSQWLDDRVRLNVAAFTSSYDNVQLLVVDPTTFFFDQQNAAEASIDGFEVEFMARPVPELDVIANVGYADSKYDELEPSSLFVGIDFEDPLILTPEWTLNFGAQYRFALGSLGHFSVRADYQYTSEICYLAACDTYDIQDGYGLLSLRGTWTNSDERMSLSVFGRNVTDKEYFSHANDLRAAGLGIAFAQIGEPAEWGIEFRYRFGY